MGSINIGQRVKVIGKNANASVAFVGETDFSDGVWIGVIFDEPKGRHDGIVEGKRYFKCSENHGLFVRPCQIDCVFSESCDSNAKKNTSGISKIPHPTCLKPNIVPKNEEYLQKIKSRSKSTERHTTKGDFSILLNAKGKELRKLTKECTELKKKLKSMEESSKSIQQKQSKEIYELKDKLKIMEDNLQNTKQKPGKGNKELKDTIKSMEDSLQGIQQKHSKAMEEMQGLRIELDNRKKQIKVQKCHINLLQMRQCDQYRKINPSGNIDLNHQKCRKRLNGENASKNVEDYPSFSDDEFDFENTKAFARTQRVIELEEQNRVMIEGLVELRDFLKNKAATVTVPQALLDKEGPMLSQRRKNLGFFVPANSELPAIEKFNHRTLGSETSESQLEKYRNILNEMTMFTKLIKEKENSKSDAVKPKTFLGDNFFLPGRLPVSTASIHSKRMLPSTTTELQFKVGDNFFKPSLSRDTESLRSDWSFNSNRTQDYMQVGTNNQINGGPFKKLQNLKQKFQIVKCGNAKIEEVIDPMLELRQLMRGVKPKTDDKIQCTSNSSFRKQDNLVNEIHNPDMNSDTRKSDLIPRISFTLTPLQIEATVRSSRENAVISPNEGDYQKRTPFSIPMLRTGEKKDSS